MSSRPSLPAVTATRGSNASDVRSPTRGSSSASRRYGRFATTTSSCSLSGASRSPSRSSILSETPFRSVFSRATARASRLMSVAMTCTPRSCAAIAIATAPDPVPTSASMSARPAIRTRAARRTAAPASRSSPQVRTGKVSTGGSAALAKARGGSLGGSDLLGVFLVTPLVHRLLVGHGLALAEVVEARTGHRGPMEEEVRSIALLNESKTAVADELLDRSSWHVFLLVHRLYAGDECRSQGRSPHLWDAPPGGPLRIDSARLEKSRRPPTLTPRLGTLARYRSIVAPCSVSRPSRMSWRLVAWWTGIFRARRWSDRRCYRATLTPTSISRSRRSNRRERSRSAAP